MCQTLWHLYGKLSERFMELVLKTSDAARHRGFESLTFRQYWASIRFMDYFDSNWRIIEGWYQYRR